ncbi:MAG: SpoIIE family protein phosphatase [Betaproteobacteria bacterium]|nr:SpoIIE family protein phosphatase [Betaproteobacteria bacterium]
MNIPAQTQTDKLPPLRILVVDDNRTNLQILQVFLKKLGHSTITAEDGAQAVAQCAEHQPDLILLDIMMPVMDGFEAARQIRGQASERWIPIIFLSAMDRSENLVAGIEAGGDDFMSKPIDFVLIEAKMRSMQRMMHLQRKGIESLKRIEAISDSTLDAIITIDTGAKIVSCNRSTERIFGWEIGEMVGRNVNMLMPEPYHGEHDGYVRSYVQGGPPQIIGFGREVTGLRKNGTTFPMELGLTEARFEKERLFVGVIHDITERRQNEKKLRENAESLQHYYEETEAESRLARALIDQQLLRPGLKDPQLHYWLTPAENFSGDVVAAARSKDGRLFAMLADATGHGLTAAISTLPALTLFYSIVSSGAPTLPTLVGEINRLLKESMPPGRFVAATLVCADGPNRKCEVWVGGTPECLLLDGHGEVGERFPSQHMALGILDTDEELVKTVDFTCEPNSQLLIYSDGLVEAENREKKLFDAGALLAAVRNVPPYLRHGAIRSALDRHLAGLPAHDDISLLLIDCPEKRG